MVRDRFREGMFAVSLKWTAHLCLTTESGILLDFWVS